VRRRAFPLHNTGGNDGFWQRCSALADRDSAADHYSSRTVLALTDEHYAVRQGTAPVGAVFFESEIAGNPWTSRAFNLTSEEYEPHASRPDSQPGFARVFFRRS
jgi:hypothetical protein